MTNIFYNSGKTRILNADIDLEADTLKVALVTSSYSPDIDADAFFDDLSDEISGTGYTAGGKALDNAAVTEDDANDRAVLDGDDVTWTIATFTVRGAVLYKDSGSAATSPLIAYFDFGQDYSPDGEDFTIQWHTDGILALGD